jgi:cytochrome c oxidase subunit 4
MANHEPTGVHHEDHHHTEHSTGFYWKVGAVLAVVTAVEVAAFVYQDIFGHVLFLILLFALMFAKGVGVVMYFMHLKGDFKIFQFVFIVPFTIAVSFVLGMLTLLGHPDVIGIAG